MINEGDIMIYSVRRFSSETTASGDIQINPAEANKFKINLQRLTTSMGGGASNEDPVN